MTTPTPQAALMEALRQAEQSLRTIADNAGKTKDTDGEENYLREHLQVRGYANSRANVARAALAQAEAAQPVLFMSPEQLPCVKNPLAAADESGTYLPVRKTPAGKFTMPLYAAPQPAEAAPKQEAVAMTDAQILKLADDAGIVTGENLRRDGYMLHRSAGESTNVRSTHLIALVRAALAAQPQQPAPEPLTEDQVFASQEFMHLNGSLLQLSMPQLMLLVRAIERAHGIAAPQTPATTGDEGPNVGADPAACGRG